MSLFDKKKKSDAKKDEVATEKEQGSQEKVREEKKEILPVKDAKKKNAAPAGVSKTACSILVQPWITEKAHDKMAENKYIFKVVKSANKKNIKQSIEELYKVTVTGVNIINIPAKRRDFGKKTGWKSGYKKAIITLKEGNKIELFEGV